MNMMRKFMLLLAFVYFCTWFIDDNDEKIISDYIYSIDASDSYGSGRTMVHTGKLCLERMVSSRGEVAGCSFL